jgi:hypothetical protein
MDMGHADRSQEAFNQLFAGVALGVIWNLVAGLCILNLDGVWQIAGLVTYALVVVVACGAMLTIKSGWRTAVGLSVAGAFGFLVIWELSFW